jgi:hypothetical protein
MKHLLTTSLLAVALVSSHPTPSDAKDSSHRQKKVEHTRYRGENAALFLVRDGTATCADGRIADIQTSVSIEAFADGTQGSLGNTDTQAVVIFFSEFDGCVGGSRQAILFDPPAEYTQQQVQSASISGNFELIDDFTGDPIGNLAIDVELTGIGPTVHSNSHSVSQSGDFLFESSSVGMSREATASGSVRIEGTELIDAGPFATLSVDHSGEITVTH